MFKGKFYKIDLNKSFKLKDEDCNKDYWHPGGSAVVIGVEGNDFVAAGCECGKN